MVDQKVTIKYTFALASAVLFTWLLHEFFHWLTGTLLGYESIMYLNATSYAKGENPSQVHRLIVTASGPIITLLQAVLAYLLLNQRWSKYLYSLLFLPFYMRLLAGLMNFISLNDEGRIGDELGIGIFTLSFIIVSLLFYLILRISRQYNLNLKFHLTTVLLTMFFSSFLIIMDQFLKIRIL